MWMLAMCNQFALTGELHQIFSNFSFQQTIQLTDFVWPLFCEWWFSELGCQVLPQGLEMLEYQTSSDMPNKGLQCTCGGRSVSR